MHKSILLFLFLFIGWIANAQYPGFSLIKDINSFKTSFASISQKTNAVRCDFTQEKNLSMLSEKMVSSGKFYFKKSGRVRMEYLKPFYYLMIINKDKVFVKDGQKETKVSTRSNKVFQQINRIMVDCMQGTALENTDFSTRVFESKTAIMLELTPQTKGMKEMFKHIKLLIDRKDFGVISIEMVEQGGDNTLIRFTNRELNVNLQDALFSIQ